MALTTAEVKSMTYKHEPWISRVSSHVYIVLTDGTRKGHITGEGSGEQCV